MLFKNINKRPSADLVAKRLIALKYIIGYAISAPPRDILMQTLKNWTEKERLEFRHDVERMRNEYWNNFRSLGIWDVLSPKELEFTKTTMLTMTHQQQVNATWRIESVQILLWALGFISTLPSYDTKANFELLKEIPVEGIQKFVNSAHLLPNEELDKARELAELWHWRSRTRQLIEKGYIFTPDQTTKSAGFNNLDDIIRFTANRCNEEYQLQIIDEDFAVKGKAYRDLTPEEWSEVHSITIERHFTLNWLCGYAPGNQWDKTPIDT